LPRRRQRGQRRSLAKLCPEGQRQKRPRAPDRDRANLKEYTTQFHPDFLGVTGARDEIERALKGIDAVATFTKPDAHGSYQVAHSAAVAVIDPAARLVAKISAPFDPAPTAQFLAELMRRNDRASTGTAR